jgi:hypothetical protein
MSTPVESRRRWPLLVIGASAGTAVWSGWVGLGELVGFGVVHPLPGIAEGFTINTAITLPVGVEAYAVYALSVATSTARITRPARRFAWTSSVGALVLGMVGQVVYHLMIADKVTTAPWPVVAAVSCLPVLVLGFASVLWHLAGQTVPAAVGTEDTREHTTDAPIPEHTPEHDPGQAHAGHTADVPGPRDGEHTPGTDHPSPGSDAPVSLTGWGPVVPLAESTTWRAHRLDGHAARGEHATALALPEHVPAVGAPAVDERGGEPVPANGHGAEPVHASTPVLGDGPEPESAASDDEIVRAIVATGDLPSVRAIKAAHRVGNARASRIRDQAAQHLATVGAGAR